jgi:glycosyltransferase involved in cell wall biosynthesis
VIKDHLIIFFPLVDWDAPWQRYQHFATVFSKRNKVIYFEPVHSIKHLLERPSKLWKKLVSTFELTRKINENLFIFQSPPIVPFGSRSRIVNCINQFLILMLVKSLINDFREKKNLCLWISDPTHYNLVQLLRPKISVYDCTDAIIFSNPKEQAYHDELKHRTIRDSTVCLFTSQLYCKEGRRYSDNCHYIPNGVDIKNFKRRYYAVPKEMEKIKRPILGFVGTIDARIDQILVREILIKMPDVSLIFVGPITDELHELRAEDRVFLLGKKDYEEIPDFINQFDVALIPYRLYENTKFMYPVKLHEYLVMGKPVVSTNLPEVEQFSEVIHIAKDEREFIKKIEESLQEKDEKRRKRRIETALANTWDHRLKMIERELERVIRGKTQDRIQE